MTCREFTEFLMERLSGEMPESERVRFEAHRTECDDCLAYLKSYEETIRLGKAVFTDPDDPVPAEVPEELVQAVLSSRAKEAD